MPEQKHRLLLIISLLALTIWLSAPVHAQEEEATPEGPTAVTLVSFTATPLNNAVKLVWITGTELNTAGFRLQRGAPGGPFEYLDYLGDDASGIIYGLGGVSDGAIYERTDDTVQNGQTFTYILLEIENDGSEVEPDNARVTVTVGLPPTNTPVSVIVPGSTATPTRPTGGTTSTATAVSTRVTTAATAASAATATPISFATVTPAARQATATPPAAAVTNTGSPGVNPTAVPPTPTRPQANDAALSETTFTGGVALAQAEETPLPAAPEAVQTAYPAAGADNAADYPIDQPTATPTPTVGPSLTRLAVIGSAPGYDGAANANNQAQAAGGNGRGTLFLWLGFIVALLIFITGVIGSIILYTRRPG